MKDIRYIRYFQRKEKQQHTFEIVFWFFNGMSFIYLCLYWSKHRITQTQTEKARAKISTKSIKETQRFNFFT